MDTAKKGVWPLYCPGLEGPHRISIQAKGMLVGSETLRMGFGQLSFVTVLLAVAGATPGSTIGSPEPKRQDSSSRNPDQCIMPLSSALMTLLTSLYGTPSRTTRKASMDQTGSGIRDTRLWFGQDGSRGRDWREDGLQMTAFGKIMGSRFRPVRWPESFERGFACSSRKRTPILWDCILLCAVGRIGHQPRA